MPAHSVVFHHVLSPASGKGDRVSCRAADHGRRLAAAAGSLWFGWLKIALKLAQDTPSRSTLWTIRKLKSIQWFSDL